MTPAVGYSMATGEEADGSPHKHHPLPEGATQREDIPLYTPAQQAYHTPSCKAHDGTQASRRNAGRAEGASSSACFAAHMRQHRCAHFTLEYPLTHEPMS